MGQSVFSSPGQNQEDCRWFKKKVTEAWNGVHSNDQRESGGPLTVSPAPPSGFIRIFQEFPNSTASMGEGVRAPIDWEPEVGGSFGARMEATPSLEPQRTRYYSLGGLRGLTLLHPLHSCLYTRTEPCTLGYLGHRDTLMRICMHTDLHTQTHAQARTRFHT